MSTPETAESGPKPLTGAERESLARLTGGHIVPLNGHPCITCAVQAEVARIVAERLAPVEALAVDLAAWDLADMVVPESVDVPDDYELAMNDAGALLHTALRPTSPAALLCAVIRCQRPQGTPHVDDCPYFGHDGTHRATPPGNQGGAS